jgi:hypothetical protein
LVNSIFGSKEEKEIGTRLYKRIEEIPGDKKCNSHYGTRFSHYGKCIAESYFPQVFNSNKYLTFFGIIFKLLTIWYGISAVSIRTFNSDRSILQELGIDFTLNNSSVSQTIICDRNGNARLSLSQKSSFSPFVKKLIFMKKDIDISEVTDVYIAAVLNKEVGKSDAWYIYLINDKPIMIDGVMITSRGYKESGLGLEVVSSTLRHAIGNVPYKTAAKVELIDSQVFTVYNEYWVTFFEDGKLMEKKFTFGPHTIDDGFLEDLPVMKQKGIIVK